MAIDGTYKGTAQSRMGSAGFVLDVKEGADGTLAGTVSAMGVSAPIQNGKLKGNGFTCQVDGRGPFGQVKMDIVGTVEDGRISGTVSSGLLKATFEAARA